MKIWVFLLFIIASISSFAQDIIYKKDKTKIEGKVIKVGINEIEYLKSDSLNAKVKSISISEVTLIAYSNGSFDDFDTQNIVQNTYISGNKRKKTAAFRYDSLYTKNIISYHLADLFFYNLTGSYERILNSGKYGIKIPFRLGSLELDEGSIIGFSLGADLNYYPTGQGRLKYYVGPSLEIGSANEDVYSYSDSFNSGYIRYPEGEKKLFVAAYINNGGVFQIARNFSMAMGLGVGVYNGKETEFIGTLGSNNVYIIEQKETTNYRILIAKFEFNLGLRF